MEYGLSLTTLPSSETRGIGTPTGMSERITVIIPDETISSERRLQGMTNMFISMWNARPTLRPTRIPCG